MKIKTLIFLILLSNITLYAKMTYKQYLKQQNQQYTQYKENLEKEFKAYKKAYSDAFKEFSKQLGKKWPKENNKPETTTKHKFVEYSKDLNSKKVVDFDKKEIKLEVIANTKQEAKKKIAKMFDNLMKEDIKTAYKNDILEKLATKKLKKQFEKPKSTQKIVADILSQKEKNKLKKELMSKRIKVVKYNGKFIYKANVKLPSNALVQKAKRYKTKVLQRAKKEKLPASLIYAIMHSESSFNPMARSYIPAFGLMQVVPRSAGLDAYKYLYKKRKVLSSSYLYDGNNNITIGSGYLHLLYYSYLRKIKNPTSRIYCTIAAYNTGAGNIAKAFTGKTNINKAAKQINRLTPQQVYKHLMRNLPYNETKHYLKKVSNRMNAYHQLLQTRL